MGGLPGACMHVILTLEFPEGIWLSFYQWSYPLSHTFANSGLCLELCNIH